MDTTKSTRGFASMDPVKQKQIASMGGKSAHAKGVAHEFTSEEAKKAGKMNKGKKYQTSSNQIA